MPALVMNVGERWVCRPITLFILPCWVFEIFIIKSQHYLQRETGTQAEMVIGWSTSHV